MKHHVEQKFLIEISLTPVTVKSTPSFSQPMMCVLFG